MTLSTSRLMTPAVSLWLAPWSMPFHLGDGPTTDRRTAWAGLPPGCTASRSCRHDQRRIERATIVRNERIEHPHRWNVGWGNITTRLYARNRTDHPGCRLRNPWRRRHRGGGQTAHAGSFAIMRPCGMTAVGGRMVHAAAGRQDGPRCFYEVRRPSSLGSTQ
jgi:hypothetical protein